MLWFKEQLKEEITSHPRIEASLWLGNGSAAGWKVEPGGKPAVVAGARDTRKEASVSRKEYSGFFPAKDPRVPLIG